MEESVELCPKSTCIPFINLSRKPKRTTTVIPPKDDFNLITALENTYNVIQLICSYLPYKDLTNMRPLSDGWKLFIEEEIARRSDPAWFQYVTCERKYGKLLKSAKNYDLLKPGLDLILFDFEKLSLEKFVCVHKGIDDEDLERKNFYSHLIDDMALPDSKFVCFSLKSIFDCNLNANSAETTLYTWFHIPPIPNVRVLSFYYQSQKPTKELFQEHEHIDTLLVFSVQDPGRQLKHLANLIRSRQKLNLSFGGGVVWGMKTNSNDKRIQKRNDLFCITFVRDRTIEDDEFFSASTIIRTKFEKNILKFKDKLQFREHCVLFRFCCCEKCDSEEEDRILRKYFPSVHLVQMDVNGEFGCNYNPIDFKDEGDVNEVYYEMQYIHGFTSIMVFISWGKLN